LIFEGAQGALLDSNYGFWPHVTRTDTTFNNAEKLLHGSAVRMTRLGVLRAYATRHGAGPFPSENAWLTKRLPDKHNRGDEWQGAFRVGWPDLLATRYALKVCGGADSLAITNLDRLYDLERLKVAVAYQYRGDDRSELDRFFEWKKIGGAAVIQSIKLTRPPNREHQAQLTKHLLKCKPIYRDFDPLFKPFGTKQSLPPEAKKYLSFLETALDTPISIVSIGPTATEKIQLKPCI
jgi:adenylosuccinate synthase